MRCGTHYIIKTTILDPWKGEKINNFRVVSRVYRNVEKIGETSMRNSGGQAPPLKTGRACACWSPCSYSAVSLQRNFLWFLTGEYLDIKGWWYHFVRVIITVD